ncbi:non-specific lipid transfer protein-like 1 [Coffea eugenioides]|uniref:Bifunctional inhibitor/plant lipid transfer protein/seed storage helical domain-containing protein n=1 Tax=Coffea arabica TaxID=13443 RepID=A0A6P6WZY2_COFAR|nr:non-specific lipid transfer protein-like 1 [Coffea arabica]XP_027164853.1 non-specific lipid transfer protein-like 1 [Coffea eugenioides]
MALQQLFPALSIALVLLSLPVYGQINSPCTTSMLTSFTPCLNFITNSSTNGNSPTADCCNVIKAFMANSTGCLCLVATGGVPFNLPINRTLVLSLPRTCNQPGVPLQCKASVAPIPAPGPLAGGPAVSPAANPPTGTMSPAAAPPTGSVVPQAGSPTLAPEAETNPALTPPSSTTNSGSPAGNSGNRQSVTPSAASTLSFSPLLLLAVIGAIALRNY